MKFVYVYSVDSVEEDLEILLKFVTSMENLKIFLPKSNYIYSFRVHRKIGDALREEIGLVCRKATADTLSSACKHTHTHTLSALQYSNVEGLQTPWRLKTHIQVVFL